MRNGRRSPDQRALLEPPPPPLGLNLTKSNTVGQITIGVKYGDFIKKIGGDNTLFPPYVLVPLYVHIVSGTNAVETNV